MITIKNNNLCSYAKQLNNKKMFNTVQKVNAVVRDDEMT